MPVCARMPVKEDKPDIVRIPVESVCRTRVPVPTALLDTSNAALPMDASLRPAGFKLIEPVLMASALALLACVIEDTFGPTPP